MGRSFILTLKCKCMHVFLNIHYLFKFYQAIEIIFLVSWAMSKYWLNFQAVSDRIT
jgi:hypothetical protein